MLSIRAMALGEVTLRDWWRVMRKEFLAGLMLGCVLGSIGFLRVAVWAQFSNVYGPHWILVAFTVGIALIAQASSRAIDIAGYTTDGAASLVGYLALFTGCGRRFGAGVSGIAGRMDAFGPMLGTPGV